MQPEADASSVAPSPAETAGGGAPAPQARGQILWWLIGLIVAADQLTKLLVQQYIALFDSVPVIAGLLSLVHIRNAGVAFGILNDVAHPMRTGATTALALAALAGMMYYSRLIRAEEHLARAGLSLILGGAIGNLIDRLRLGYVVDFVDVFWGDWHFWAFNVADAAITCGAVLILFELLFPSRHVSHSV
jgi:signal peptidase II